MKVLLVSPLYPDTFWSGKHALKYTAIKALIPPMGLLTVAAMLPPEWDERLVDMNVEPLMAEHLDWADMVFISAMTIQAESAAEVIRRCQAHGKLVVAGGPHFSTEEKSVPGVDHVLLGEVEETLPLFVSDLAQGRAKEVYRPQGLPDITRTPPPLWHLLNLADYRTMPVQFSRGCPFDCEFCQVTALFGRKPRFKTNEQVLTELERLYKAGWRGLVFFVDDNLIGHKKKAKALLRRLAEWQIERGRPFVLMTQASVDMVDDPDLLDLMARAGFRYVFLGLETPAAASLKECDKRQNQNRDLVAAVKTIHAQGIEVMGGFIIGFDADPPTIFDDQVRFIEEAAIPTAMVGLLSVPPGTRLHARMKKEGRLRGMPSGDNMDLEALNFEPIMGRAPLIAGYKEVLKRLYEPEAYYRRVAAFLDQYRPNPHLPSQKPSGDEVKAFFKILWLLGFQKPGRRAFWRFLARVIARHLALFPDAVNLAISGHHYWTVSRRVIAQTG